MVFAKNRGSRVFHLMMILPAGLLLLVLSLISLSTLAVTNSQFVNEYEDKEPEGDSKCILYAEKGDFAVNFEGGNTCNYGVVGAAILGGFAIAFTILLVLKAVIGIQVVSISVVLELSLAILGAIWAFIVSVVITAGLDQTCDAYADTFGHPTDKFPCCSYFYKFEGDNIGDSSNVYFYDGINASRITAWFAVALLMFLTGLYLCILIRYCCGGKKSSPPAEPSLPDEKTEPDPI